MFYYKKLVIKTKKFFRRIIDKQIKVTEFRRPLTYYRDPEDNRDFKFQDRLLETANSIDEVLLSIPSKVDHTMSMTPVKDQLYLGSCVGFAVTAMKEWQETIENRREISEGKPDYRKGEVYDLSEAWVYWKCKEIDYWPNEEGTSIRFAMKVLNKIGVPKEKAWPYNDKDYGKPASWATMTARWNMIDSYWRIDSLSELKAALVERPVPIGVACFYEIFFVDSSGIVPYPANPNEIYGGHAVCLSADTQIPLLDGETHNIQQLSILYPDKKFWVYSCDVDGNIVPGLAHSPRKTGIKKVLKINLDNGESFKCTADHKILSRDGEYIEAQNLKINDSLMPLYKKNGIGDYEMIYNPYSDEWFYTHRVMCNNFINTQEKKVVHHKNFNKKDKFTTFKEFLEFKGIAFNNHKVISIEECGYEDVYDLTVEKYHNFAIDSGVFVHNCAVGYDDNKKLIKFKNSWGTGWGQNGYGYLPYSYIRDFMWDAWTCKDLQVKRNMLKGEREL
jgi:C1A family cysteine protease